MPRKEAEGEPKSVSFKTAKCEVSFTARSRKKIPDPDPVLEKRRRTVTPSTTAEETAKHTESTRDARTLRLDT